MIFGELVPKRIAMQKSFEWSKAAYGVVSGIAFLMRPVIALLSLSTNLVLRLLHCKVEGNDENVTEDEIRMLVDIGEEKGSIDENEKEWIQNVFDFDDLSVRRVMTPRADVIAVSRDADKEEIMHLIEENGLSRYPVYGEDLDDIVGILYARDFLLALGRGEQPQVEKTMRSAYFVPESIHADKLFPTCRKRKSILPLLWTNTAPWRVLSPWKTWWKKLWVTFMMSLTRKKNLPLKR